MKGVAGLILMNALKNTPAFFLLVLVYVVFLPHLLSYDQAWMQPEEFAIKSYILDKGNRLDINDLKRGLNWQAFEFAPRPTRPLSSYFEILDAKFRCWLWRYIPPHPSLSLTWIFSFIFTPLLLFLFLRSLRVNSNIAICCICLYVLSPQVLGATVMLFRPAKIMANFSIILCLYLASRLNREGAPFSRYLLFVGIVFVSFFWDETALLIYPAVILFFPALLKQRLRFIAFLLLPLFALFSYHVLIPYLTVLAGHPYPDLNGYEAITKTAGVLGKNFWQVFWDNSRLLIFETAGIVPVSSHAPLFMKAIFLSALAAWCFIVFLMIKTFDLNKQCMRWLAAVCGLLLFHNYLVAITNVVWGPYYYGNFWSLFFIIFLCLALKKVNINSRALFLCSALICLNLFYSFMETNLIYKKWHYYPYHPLRIAELFTNKIQRFDPRLRVAFSGDELKTMVLGYWNRMRNHPTRPPAWRLPKELFWLVLELNPGEQQFYYRQLWGDSQAVFYQSKSGG